jgi:hypothetical protein
MPGKLRGNEGNYSDFHDQEIVDNPDIDFEEEAEMYTEEVHGQNVVNYYFPVEVVVVGSLPEEEREIIKSQIWEQLNDALDRNA